MGHMTNASFRITSVLTLCIIVASFSVPVITRAAEFRTGDAAIHPKDQLVINDLYMLGGSITSSGPVRGDLITFGVNILINGAVSADVAASGGTISILSDIGGDVRAAAGTVVIQGVVGGDILAAGGQVNVSSPKVGGDVVAAGGVVRIDAPVTGNVQIAGGDVRIDSAVNGNVDIQAENVTLGPKAHIDGTFSYSSPRQATIDGGAIIIGATKYTQSPDVRQAAKLGLIAFFSVWFVAKMFMVFSGALVVGYVYQRYADEFVACATKRPLAEFGRGVVFFIVTPIISVLLLFTVIGIAFGALGLLGFAMMLIFGAMLVPLLIGSVVHKYIFKQNEYEVTWKTILTGTLLYFIIGSIPFIGTLIMFGITLLAMGTALAIKGKILNEWR